MDYIGNLVFVKERRTKKPRMHEKPGNLISVNEGLLLKNAFARPFCLLSFHRNEQN